jgi:hypothetical protein
MNVLRTGFGIPTELFRGNSNHAVPNSGRFNFVVGVRRTVNIERGVSAGRDYYTKCDWHFDTGLTHMFGRRLNIFKTSEHLFEMARYTSPV